ncbi:MAG: radical SAM protein [Candidatus Bruticola sp.]
MDTNLKIIRRTASVCPTCLRDVPAYTAENDGKIYLYKECPEHGLSKCLISEHADYYVPLDNYFFEVMQGKELRQRDYLVRMTEKCNLQCPICLASADSNTNQAPPPIPDLKLEQLVAFMERNKGRKLKIDLISAEPTLCQNLPEFLNEIHKRGHIASLHTNGIKLADYNYAKSLKEAGLDEVFLQFDGFDDDAYMRIRGARLTHTKLKTLKNLQDLGIAVSLVMVIMPNCNEKEIGKVLDYAREHNFVREVMFLGTRALGYFRDSQDLLMPDQVIDLVHQQSGGLCPRQECFFFQKLYFALLSFLGVRKCLYVQHNLLIRSNKQFMSISDFVDWSRVEPVLDMLPQVQTIFDKFMWFLRLGFSLLSLKTLKLLPDFFSLFVRLKLGWNLSQLPHAPLLIGYITACDPLNVDRQIGNYCGKGEIAVDIGMHESGSEANIERERWWSAQTRRIPKK